MHELKRDCDEQDRYLTKQNQYNELKINHKHEEHQLIKEQKLTIIQHERNPSLNLQTVFCT